MLDQYFSFLFKEGKQLNDEAKLQDFFQPWPNFIKYINEIFAYIRQSNFYVNSSMTLFKA